MSAAGYFAGYRPWRRQIQGHIKVKNSSELLRWCMPLHGGIRTTLGRPSVILFGFRAAHLQRLRIRHKKRVDNVITTTQ